MIPEKKKKIIRLLGVGYDEEDGHIRITNTENFDVMMGSEESHEHIQNLLLKIERELQAKNLSLDDLSPNQFLKFIKDINL
jgi:hypothetical protein